MTARFQFLNTISNIQNFHNVVQKFYNAGAIEEEKLF